MKPKTGLFLLSVLTWLGASPGAWAQGVLTVNVINGYNVVVDSNVTAPSTYGPASAYIGASFCNTGNAPLTNVIGYTGSYNGGVGSTPGLFPVKTFGADPLRPQLAGTGDYSLTLAAGSAGLSDATRYIGTLNPGECRIQYWLFTYPQCVNVNSGGTWVPQSPPCTTSITGGIKPDDDLSLNYDVWGTATGLAAVNQTRSFTMRNEISAAANKIWPNTTAKVPDEYLAAIQSVIGWGTLGPDGRPLSTSNAVYPGQRVITTQGIWYDLGNVGQGFDNDGDLIPDQNAWLQPVGDPSKFDAGCFRMVNAYGIVIVKLKTGGELLIPFQNQLYNTHLPDNTGVVGLVYYQYIATNEGCNSAMTPYQEAASGYDNEKFSSDFGLSNPLLSGTFGAGLSFTKSDGVTTTAAGSTLTYTISATNNTKLPPPNDSLAGVPLGAPDLGVPLVFKETILAGTTYVQNSASSALTPPSGSGSYYQGYTDASGTLQTCLTNYTITASSYTILYSTDGGNTWSLTQPASGVTNIQWILSTTLSQDGGPSGTTCHAPGTGYTSTLQTSLPPGKTASVQFQDTVGGTVGPVLCNTATLGFGSGVSRTQAQDCDLVTGNNGLSGTVFQDNGLGVGGIFGDGVQDGTEAGIGAGVVVKLYYDANANGRLDSTDLLYGSTTTSASGTYSFGSLPDGRFLVVAKKYDGATSDGITNAVNEMTCTSATGSVPCAGWGDTTKDPNLALTTNQGILKLGEDLTTVTLAVNIDLPGTNGVAQSITNVNFGFAPPLTLTKTVANTTVNEGTIFSYTINLQNRLPSVGVQGPTGCQYTVWAPTGTNGSPAGKAFTDPANAWDGPNQTVASAVVTGGGLRFIQGTGFPLSTEPGNITKVEALFMGYFSTALTDDTLTLQVTRAGNTVQTTMGTALIDNYVGPPPDLDPNSAISWDVTSVRPGGGTWSWADNFSALTTYINPSKATSADQKNFYLDAMGVRVTTDADCVAGPSTTLNPVPLQDRFDTGSFTFVSASIPPTSLSGGTIQWDNVGPILPGSTASVTVTVQAAKVTGTRAGTCATLPPPANSACNLAETAYGTKHVFYADGRQANDASASVPVNIVQKAELYGTVYKDVSPAGWPIGVGDVGLPDVGLTLWACVHSDGQTLETGTQNKTCAAMTAGNFWKAWKTTTTDASGNYSFIGLDSGYYLVEVGDTDGAPAAGNASPYSGTQTAEPNDAQGVSGTSPTFTASGHTCPTCDNTWGSPTANVSAMRLLGTTSATESISGINFGYTISNAVIYGNVWWDKDGNAATDPGDTGLAGFTVQLYNGVTLVATTISDSYGNYTFNGLAAGSYTIQVTPPTLKTQAWAETVESVGGTGSLDNQIPVTVAAGSINGSFNFGYTLKSTASIGDTVYLDLNGNGRQDAGEAGIAGVSVSLYQDVDRSGAIDPGVDLLVGTQVTDASGKYLFQDLAVGSYVTKIDTTTLPTNVTATEDPDVNHGAIGGKVFQDLNRNGALNAGEDGLEGVVVRLYADANGNGTRDDAMIAATITDANGNYLFGGLNAGSYFVDVDTTTLPSSAGSVTTSPNPFAATSVVTLASNTSTNTAVNAGYQPSTGFVIGNRVWHDVNNNGVQDAGEPGIPGVRVTVTGVGTATTDAAGFWSVLVPATGTYTATVDTTTLPRDFILTSGANPRSVAITGDNVSSFDFGFRYNPAQGASPTGTITGRVFLDKNANGTYDSGLNEAMSGTTVDLLDADNNVVATASTAADGTYAFNGVFVGDYSVQAVDKLGTRFSVLFVSAGSSFPNLNVIYDNTVATVADSQGVVSVDGVHPDLRQDFGYKRFQGSIGDTVYQDVNGNATQDLGEPGIPGVRVYLYHWADANGDGVVDAGELSNAVSTVTTADDPATAADEGGKYLFANLADPVGFTYLVRVDPTTLPSVSTLTADPDTDGVPCTISPTPAGCDSQQAVTAFKAGNNYLGADFGYQITGANYGKIGDHLWIDTNGNGILDSGEKGVPYATVYLDDNNDGVFNFTDSNGNGKFDAGEPATDRYVRTDADGYYLFTNLPAGTYRVRVLGSTIDANWPALLSSTPTFEVRSGNTSLNNAVDVTIDASGLTSTVADGSAGNCTSSCDPLSVDFGYRYPGTKTLRGTVCADDNTGAPRLGNCGATSTQDGGVGSGEAALAGVEVFLYMWTDGGMANQAWNSATGVLDPGDTFTLLGSATTDANGDYSFSNVPDNVVTSLSVFPSQNLRLTTTNANSAVQGTVTKAQLYETTTTYQGNTVTSLVRQALKLGSTPITNLDYAFDATLGGTISYEFGDLPNSGTPNYNATLLSSGGAQHRIGTVWLGPTLAAKTDGCDSSTASCDLNDDGVTLVGMQITTGPGGGSITITTTAPACQVAPGCWLGGWIDFNQNGNFGDAGEHIVSQLVFGPANPTSQTITFDVPLDANGGVSGTATYFARFRIYPAQPFIESSTGVALDSSFQPMAGEVEDYMWTLAVTRAVISSFVARDVSGAMTLEWRTASEIGTAGWFLRRYDDREGRWVDVNEKLLPALLGTHVGGVYRYVDEGAVPGYDYAYQLVEVEARGTRNSYGPFSVNTSRTLRMREPVVGPKGFVGDPATRGYLRAAKSGGARATQIGARAAAESATAAASAAGKHPVTAAKVGVGQSGIYYVSLRDLQARAGLAIPREWLNSNRNAYALTNRGATVAFTASPDLTGILFYGQAAPSLFERDNVYRVGESTADSPRMKVRKDIRIQPSHGDATFPRTVHAEQQVYDLTNLFTDPQADFWMWDWVFAGWGSKTFTFRTDGAARTGPATITVRLKGATDTPANPDHHATVNLNGSQIGDVSWNGLEGASPTFSFDASLLVDGENTLEVVGLTDTEAPYSVFYLDNFDVSYASRYRAFGNKAEVPAAEHSAILISGFTRPDILVFDVTVPTRPVIIQASTGRLPDGSYGVSLAPDTPDTVYYAVTPDAFSSPTRVIPDLPSRLMATDNRADYLVITSAALMDTARTLASYRSDLRSEVVDIEDVYDEFNLGIASPVALKEFLTYARARWASPPRYVLLAGDGTYDYKDNLGYGANIVPPMIVTTPQGLVPSDTWFGDAPLSRGADVAIGRLPVATAEELAQAIGKIQTREAATQQPWLQRLLLLAEIPDAAGNFPAGNERVAALAPPDVQVQRAYISVLGASAARTSLLDAINQGTGLINYFGHGGYDVLANEVLLSSADADRLTNAATPFVMTGMTCLINDFAVPGYPSLGEVFVRKDGAGAVAIWAPTGMSEDDLAVLLAEGFYSAVYGGTAARIGDAILASRKAYEQGGRPRYMTSMYTLLGDPAMRLH